jgi:hypothetical protein
MIQRYKPGELGKRHDIMLPFKAMGRCLEWLKTQKTGESLNMDGEDNTSTEDPTDKSAFGLNNMVRCEMRTEIPGEKCAQLTLTETKCIPGITAPELQ